MTKLNDRQMALYNYLVRKMEGTDYVTKHLLMLDLDGWYNRSEEKGTIHNSSAYRTLRKDIEVINQSTAQYVILPYKENKKLVGYKLATSNDEISKQADKLGREALRLWKRARELRRKARNNGQVRFASGSKTKEIRSEVKK